MRGMRYKGWVCLLLTALFFLQGSGMGETEDVQINVLPAGEVAPILPDPSAYFPDGSGYADDTISVHIETTRAFDTKIFLTYVRIADASQLRTAGAKSGAFDRGRISKKPVYAEIIARRVHAVLAIDGDYFVDRKECCIIRNFVLQREADFGTYDALLIDARGDMHILKTPSRKDFEAAADTWGPIMHSFAFGPGLIIDVEVQEDYCADTMGGTKKRAQSQVLCQTGPLSYLCVTCHGPEQKGSKGLTLPELGEFLSELGVEQAYNLDGGSSTWLVLNGEKINTRSKRPIADILSFATAHQGE